MFLHHFFPQLYDSADMWVGRLCDLLDITLLDERGFYQQSIMQWVPLAYRPNPTLASHRAQPLDHAHLPTHRHFVELFAKEREAEKQCLVHR